MIFMVHVNLAVYHHDMTFVIPQDMHSDTYYLVSCRLYS